MNPARRIAAATPPFVTAFATTSGVPPFIGSECLGRRYAFAASMTNASFAAIFASAPASLWWF